MPKRPDRGSEGDLGMVAGYKSGYEVASGLLRIKVVMIVILLDSKRLS